uniref:c-type cytochrome n=1 Tax=Ningiella ruwaisensis TaxID=2364274 RepID=UPI0010A005D5|nr:cytochrome c [Ningiella ruwaisensis]
MGCTSFLLNVIYVKKTVKALSLSILGLIALLFLGGCSQGAASGNIEAGEEKSAICAQCHGRNGISIVPIYPNLAGQKEQYLVLSLKAYRSGERVNMAMTPHARKLSDEDIADLAAYYANMDPRGADAAQ